MGVQEGAEKRRILVRTVEEKRGEKKVERSL